MNQNNKSNNKSKKSKKRVKKPQVVTSPKKTAPKLDLRPLANHAKTLAAGARANIMIIPNIDEQAIQAAPESLVTMALTRGWIQPNSVPIYWAYLALLGDLIAIINNRLSPLPARLEYLNGILASLCPKSVPFKTSTLDYSWKISTISDSPSITNRGYEFYMYERTGNINSAGWKLQEPPANATDENILNAAVANLFNLLARDEPGRHFIRGIDFLEDYAHDVSSYAAVSPYFGQGSSSSSSAVCSVENEVPFKSNILAVYTAYTPADGRVARNFNTGSGDSVAAYGLGMCPEFDYKCYATRFPPIYKFLDLDEVVYALQFWYTNLVSLAISKSVSLISGPSYQTDLNFALEPFQFTAQQFRLAVRQCVLSMFANSAAITQNIRYSGAQNSFEPFRCGTNAYPPTLQTNLQIPSVLNENLRMLKMRGYDVGTKYYNNKNKLYYIPVWGTFKSATAPNVFGSFWNESTSSTSYGPMFAAPVQADDPRMVDGTDALNGCCDLNDSDYLSSIITEWNNRLDVLREYSVQTGMLGGEGNGILLSMTRYVTYGTVDDDISKMTNYQKKKLNKEFIVTRKVKRTLSSKLPETEKEYYVPPNGSLGTQFSRAFSSLTEITETVKTATNYFILPHIVLETGQVPTTPQNRTYTLEGNVLDLVAPINNFDNTTARISNYAAGMVTGTAGAKNEELASIVQKLNETGKGGFLSSLVQQLAPLIPF